MHVRQQTRGERTTSRRRAQRRMPLALGLAAVALTAACGGGYGGTSTAASSGPGGSAAVLATSSTGLGTILVTGRGQTVYEFAADTGTTSHCEGSCAGIWPPVVAPDPLPTSLAGVSGPVGSTTRTDGSRQLTVAGHPVYVYSGDTAPGDTNGQDLDLDGGVWNVVSPAGAPVTGSGSSSTSSY